MEQEKRVSLNADVMLRRALDLKADNVLIAEFMCGALDPATNLNKLKYHSSWDWLMPVIDKCYQEHMSKHIADVVMTCDIDKAHQVIVKFINQLKTK